MDALKVVLDRAVERDEVDPSKIAPRIIRLPLDLARYEMFVSRRPLTKKQIAEIVDDIFMPLIRRA